jgi:hypothetical protein
MADNERVPDPHSSHENSMLRQLKVLVILLLLSNIALGAFGFYFLRRIDQRYSSLIVQAVPAMNQRQRAIQCI